MCTSPFGPRLGRLPANRRHSRMSLDRGDALVPRESELEAMNFENERARAFLPRAKRHATRPCPTFRNAASRSLFLFLGVGALSTDGVSNDEEAIHTRTIPKALAREGAFERFMESSTHRFRGAFVRRSGRKRRDPHFQRVNVFVELGNDVWNAHVPRKSDGKKARRIGTKRYLDVACRFRSSFVLLFTSRPFPEDPTFVTSIFDVRKWSRDVRRFPSSSSHTRFVLGSPFSMSRSFVSAILCLVSVCPSVPRPASMEIVGVPCVRSRPLLRRRPSKRIHRRVMERVGLAMCSNDPELDARIET